MDDDSYRQLAADSLAHRMVLQILLSKFLTGVPPEHRESIAADIVARAQRYDHLVKVVRDDERTEFRADVTVRAQLSVEQLVADAMTGVPDRTV